MSSVAAKVRAARAFGEYLSQSHPENRNGAGRHTGNKRLFWVSPLPQAKARTRTRARARASGV